MLTITKDLKYSVKTPDLLVKPLVIHLISYLLGLSVYILVFYALGIPSTPELYVVVYFIATAVQDAAATFSVGSLDIILASIFLLYGLNAGVSGIAALLMRSVGFWFPLFVGFLAVQYLGAKNLLSQTPQLEKYTKERATEPQPELSNVNVKVVVDEHFH